MNEAWDKADTKARTAMRAWVLLESKSNAALAKARAKAKALRAKADALREKSE